MKHSVIVEFTFLKYIIMLIKFLLFTLQKFIIKTKILYLKV